MTYSLACGCVKAHSCDAVVRRGEVPAGSVLRACEAHGGPAVPPGVVGVTGAGRKRYAAGRRVQVPRQVRTTRDLIRRHLREEGINMRDLASPWNVVPGTVKKVMSQRTPLPPQNIDAFIQFLKLDEFDALELRFQGAIEAGWQIEDIKKARL